MRLYADLRSFQDPCYAFRGIGTVGAAVLRHVHSWFPRLTEIVALLDEQLPALPEVYRSLVDRVQYDFAIRGGQPTLFYQPSPMTHEPSCLAGVVDRPSVFAAAIVYDFIPLDEPRYLPTVVDRRRYLNNIAWLKRYQAFGAISAYSARRLSQVLAPPPETIAVVGASIRSTFVQFDPTQLSGQPLRTSFQPGQYFVLVGGHDPRKNAECAVAAVALASRRLSRRVGLVVAGDYGEDYKARLQQRFQECGGSPENLQFLKGLSDLELAGVYHHALGALCPSRMEGFSLPVVEAMACSCPVLASAIEAHRELVEQPEALFQPDEEEHLARLLVRLAEQKGWAEELRRAQAGVAPRFAEEKVAERFWCHVRQRWQQSRRTASVRRGLRPRLAWLSPYPPDRSGVADYTASTVKALAEHVDVDVFVDSLAVAGEGEGPRRDPWVRKYEPVTTWPYVSGEYDAVVAVIGNSHFHARIIDAHKRFGGACLMHDNRLAEFYFWRDGLERYAEFAGRSLGRPVGIPEAETWLREPHRLPTLLFDEIIYKANPFMVHSRGVRDRVKKQYGVSAEYLPFCCYRHFSDEELSPVARREARRRLDIPEDRLFIVTLGILSHTKGPVECLWALEQLHAWGVPADLCFVGPGGAFKQVLFPWIEQLGLEGHVRFLDDWISEETYRDYLRAADLGLQLRTYGFGQISGALSDCISAGLPTVANEDLADSVDGPAYVLRIPDQLSPVLVAERLLEAYESGRHRTRTGPDRSAYIREHSFEHYAANLLKVLKVA